MCDLGILEYIGAKHPLIPLRENSKQPILKEWQNVELQRGDVRRWLSEGCNFGIRCDHLVVLDFDEKQAGREWFRRHRSVCKVIVETRRGVHLYFKRTGDMSNRVKAEPDLDIRAGRGGYVVAPSSRVDGFTYSFVEGFDDLDLLADFDPTWVRSRPTLKENRVEKVAAYLARVESIQGQNGSGGLLRAACICRDSGLSQAEAMAEIVKWNQAGNAVPPWSMKELARAVTRAYEVYNAQSNRNQ